MVHRAREKVQENDLVEIEGVGVPALKRSAVGLSAVVLGDYASGLLAAIPHAKYGADRCSVVHAMRQAP